LAVLRPKMQAKPGLLAGSGATVTRQEADRQSFGLESEFNID